MAIDKELLEDARQAGVRAADAQCAADVAKAEYHRAIRRLQLAGATMREIAEALGLSHQRVQQIVDANGGGRRWARRRRDESTLLSCTFCRSDHSHVKKLIAGPGVYICDGCIEAAKSIAGGSPLTTQEAAGLQASAPGATGQCGFCGKPRSDVHAIVVVAGQAPLPAAARGKYGVASICDECLALCTEIIEHKSGA